MEKFIIYELAGDFNPEAQTKWEITDLTIEQAFMTLNKTFMIQWEKEGHLYAYTVTSHEDKSKLASRIAGELIKQISNFIGSK